MRCMLLLQSLALFLPVGCMLTTPCVRPFVEKQACKCRLCPGCFKKGGVVWWDVYSFIGVKCPPDERKNRLASSAHHPHKSEWEWKGMWELSSVGLQEAGIPFALISLIVDSSGNGLFFQCGPLIYQSWTPKTPRFLNSPFLVTNYYGDDSGSSLTLIQNR